MALSGFDRRIVAGDISFAVAFSVGSGVFPFLNNSGFVIGGGLDGRGVMPRDWSAPVAM